MSLNGYFTLEGWLQILVFIHVLSAIVGIGPTYFSHVLLRKGQTLGQLRSSVAYIPLLEKFPKVLGSLAVVSGILLAWLGDYGFEFFWIYGSLALYVLIQIIVIAFMTPDTRKLIDGTKNAEGSPELKLSSTLEAQVARANRWNYVTAILGSLLFLLMFFKPTL